MAESENNNGKRIGKALYLIYWGYLGAAVLILYSIIHIQLSYAPPAAIAKDFKATSSRTILYPNRGSILAKDGRLLAMSVPEYQIYMDCTVLKQQHDEWKASDDAKTRAKGDSAEVKWRRKAVELAKGLAEIYKDKSADAYYKEIIYGRENNKRYMKIGNRRVDHAELQKLHTLPLFCESKYTGGMATDTIETRQYPYGELARRTIGYVNNNREKNTHIGLEGKFDYYLHGTDGYKWMKETDLHGKIQDYDSTWAAAIDGFNLRTTLDIDIQDIADRALRKNMMGNKNIIKGCMIVMDVETGAIRAMVNLSRDTVKNTLNETYNMAIREANEPGSVFKLTTLMTLLEDGKIKLDDEIPTRHGRVKDYEKYLQPDSYMTRYEARTGKNTITIRHGLELSSNYVFSQLAVDHYEKNPEHLIQKLYSYRLGESRQALDFDLEGLTNPTIPDPSSKSWSKSDLPSVAIGYTVSETPLYILMFYNAIANGGKMVKPYLVESLERMGEVVINNKPSPLSGSICSKATADTLKKALRGIVTNPYGTAHRSLHTSPVEAAGKTGTSRLILEGKDAIGKRTSRETRDGKYKYRATFVGFFPYDKPKYSAISVMITSPLPKTSAVYGGTPPALAFRELMDKIYAMDPENGKLLSKEGKMPDLRAELPEPTEEGMVPDVTGLGLNDAVYVIEDKGFTCIWEGRGHVMSQVPSAGTAMNKGQTVHLILK